MALLAGLQAGQHSRCSAPAPLQTDGRFWGAGFGAGSLQALSMEAAGCHGQWCRSTAAQAACGSLRLLLAGLQAMPHVSCMPAVKACKL